MTRLQKMFITLARYKSVEELEKGTSDLFVSDLFVHLAFDLDGNVTTCGHFPNCKACSIGCDKSKLSPYELTRNYLNEECSPVGIHPSINEIMRNKALESLESVFIGAQKDKLSPYGTALLLDCMCNLLEHIGLFESNECHDKLLEITRKGHNS